MWGMFKEAFAFNKPIGNWNTEKFRMALEMSGYEWRQLMGFSMQKAMRKSIQRESMRRTYRGRVRRGTAAQLAQLMGLTRVKMLTKKKKNDPTSWPDLI